MVVPCARNWYGGSIWKFILIVHPEQNWSVKMQRTLKDLIKYCKRSLRMMNKCSVSNILYFFCRSMREILICDSLGEVNGLLSWGGSLSSNEKDLYLYLNLTNFLIKWALYNLNYISCLPIIFLLFRLMAHLNAMMRYDDGNSPLLSEWES